MGKESGNGKDTKVIYLGRVAKESLDGHRNGTCDCGACRGIPSMVRDRVSRESGYPQFCLQGETFRRWPDPVRIREEDVGKMYGVRVQGVSSDGD